ncbi:MAG: sugar phosphate isomerase/epimerase [Clostridiales bacterium]|nr:sugar phosphate isomerase/epimerase [Clostridiales bacterium]
MIKKAVITDEISQDFRTAADLAVKYGLDGVEIRSVWEKGPHELDGKDIRDIKAMLADTGLVVSAISSPFYKCDIDNADEIRENIRILRRCIDLAHELNTALVRGFTFWGKGGFEENLGKITSRFEEPIRILEQEAVTLALEFDPSVYATNAAKLVRVIEAVDSMRVRALWDPGNDIYDPDGEVPYPDGYEIIKPYMVHMHLKDAAKDSDGKAVGMPMGDGLVDYKGQFRALMDDRYDGYVVLETHYRPRHALNEELLALPKGSAFSYMGYEATEESLIKWNRLLEEIRG